MHQDLPLGHVAGIRVGASWSVLVIGLLLGAALASGLLPAAAPDRPVLAYLVVAIVGVVLFFASLLAHEVGHSLVAAHHGVRVRSITLWLFGGVAAMEHDTTDPGAEIKIAATGPVVSGALGVAWGLLAVLSAGLGADQVITAGLTWLAWINLVLAGFNLVPAFPLDGGRVLRGVLWHRWQDRLRATHAAATAGVVFGWVLVGAGAVSLLGGFVVDGVWFALIGMFVMAAARAETEAVERDELLGDVTVAEVMTSSPTTVEADAPLAAVRAGQLVDHRHAAYPVLGGDGRPAGVLLMRSLLATPSEHLRDRTAGQVAVPIDLVVSCTPQDRAAVLLEGLADDRVGRALVVDDGRLVGIVTRADLARAVARHHPQGARGGSGATAA